jgi:transcriptional regulator with XRE-family HTH domain
MHVRVDKQNKEVRGPRAVTDVDAAIGIRLRSRREMLGLTQHELAQRCNVSAQQCHKYETGASSMRASRLIQFGAALGVPVNYFFNGLEDVGHYPDDLLELFSNRANAELVRLFADISEPTIRNGLLEMARAACRAQSSNEETADTFSKKAR